MSPPPFADSLLMLSLNTSALVVMIRGPNPGYTIDNWFQSLIYFRHSLKTHRIHRILFRGKSWSRGCSTSTLLFNELLIPPCVLPTWVIERHQDVGRGLLRGSPLTVDDGEGNSLCFGDVVRHTACGVDDKTQHRGLGEAHQSVGTRGTNQTFICL